MDSAVKLQYYFLLSVSLLLAAVPQVFSATVTCRTDNKIVNYCLVSGVSGSNVEVTRTIEESPDFSCTKNVNYGFIYYSAQQSYVYALHGCGGTFQVTAPSSGSGSGPSAIWSQWGDWSSCSVRCGAGIQTRARICSTGRNADCSSNTGDSTQIKLCFIRNCGGSQTASWNTWGDWSTCSVSCGGGTQERIRTCSTTVNSDCSTNVNAYMESRVCNSLACDTGAGTPTAGSCGLSQATFGYRIIGGTAATDCQFPWMALVYNGNKGTACGGSIIDSTHILTAAHCVVSGKNFYGQVNPVSASDVRVYTGSSVAPFKQPYYTIPGSTRRQAASIKVHENYDDDAVVNDIAIITLTEPITFDKCHVPICLPTAAMDAQTTSGCKVMGWGTTSNSRYARVSSELLQTDVKVMDPNVCYRYYGYNFSRELKLCVGGTGTGSCSGDSGGPITCPSNGRYYQYGIVSSGAYRRCGELPSMYTKVTSFLPWIKANSA